MEADVRQFFLLFEEKVHKYDLSIDTSRLFDAIVYAEKAHENQKRMSGEPYIWHPLEVASILAEYEVDEDVLIAGILHDVVEDTDISLHVLEEKFGTEVADLVDGVTKLGLISFDTQLELQVENFRKMFLAMAKDIRVVIIKLADRLHNMRTLKYLAVEKQQRIAIETKEVFAPLAHRLGMSAIKWELEDQCFRYLKPIDYQKIKDIIALKRIEREQYIQMFVDNVQKKLKETGTQAAVTGRPKHFWSIYNKMVTQNLNVNELYDLFAIRIIVNGVQDCYSALGAVHTMYKPIPGRFKDYIAVPKQNNYQSLHTTIIGPNAMAVEIQIRTVDMHRVSEYGIAAHWRYKEGRATKVTAMDKKLSWLRELLDWQEGLKNSKDFMDHLKVDLFTEEIFVFSPKGDVFELPRYSTPVDFAYHVHTEVGHRCIGAKVNHQIKPLEYTLKSGDIVEVMTSKTSNPKLSWLTFVKTTGARTKIKQWFKKESQTVHAEEGQILLEKEVKSLLLLPSEVLSLSMIKSALDHFNYKKEEDFFAGMALGDLSVKHVSHYLKTQYDKEHGIFEEPINELQKSITKYVPKKKDIEIVVDGLADVMVHLSQCCNPVPGDRIIGYITRGYGVSVHRRDCRNVSNELEVERQVSVAWVENQLGQFEVDLTIEAFDRVGLLSDILHIIAETGLNIVRANVRTNYDGIVIADFSVMVHHTDELSRVITKIRNMNDIRNIYRKVK